MHFNPRSSCEERPDAFGELFRAADISIHAPHARSDAALESSDFSAQISIHAPHARSDSRTARITRCARLNFNPRSSCEERPLSGVGAISEVKFQSTLLMRGATGRAGPPASSRRDFNPRSSCEERRGRPAQGRQHHQISIHAPHARSDHSCCDGLHEHHISIHAPHARSDQQGQTRRRDSLTFQSTLLMRGAT